MAVLVSCETRHCRLRNDVVQRDAVAAADDDVEDEIGCCRTGYSVPFSPRQRNDLLVTVNNTQGRHCDVGMQHFGLF